MAADPTSAKRRRSFGPVVLLGLAAGAVLAVAGSRVWVDYTVKPQVSLVGSDLGEVPLAGALSYLLLASWGVLLVTRGRVRRGFAVVGALASLGLAACVVYALVALPAVVRDRFPATGFDVSTGYTAWTWAALVAVLLSLAATGLAVRLTPGWPEMGRRYDSPADQVEAVRAVDPDDPEAGNLELWKAMDKGDDPTA